MHQQHKDRSTARLVAEGCGKCPYLGIHETRTGSPTACNLLVRACAKVNEAPSLWCPAVVLLVVAALSHNYMI